MLQVFLVYCILNCCLVALVAGVLFLQHSSEGLGGATIGSSRCFSSHCEGEELNVSGNEGEDRRRGVWCKSGLQSKLVRISSETWAEQPDEGSQNEKVK